MSGAAIVLALLAGIAKPTPVLPDCRPM